MPTNHKHRDSRKRKTLKKRSIVHGKILSKKAGWTIAEIRGSPFQRGFAHGFILSAELFKIKQVLPFLAKDNFSVSYKKFISDSNKHVKPKVKKHFPEFYQEIKGISKGAEKGGIIFSSDEILAWNAYMTMYSFYKDGGSERCSAFIATGKATKNGDIIMAHNTHSDFISGKLFNVVLYVYPEKGHHFVMQTAAGLISSTTDWFECASGIIGCETTIADINYKPVFGTPFFCRIRQAMQYGNSLDDYVDIMLDKNAGDYAGSWQFGDVNTGEIMLFELGLKIHNVQRTKNGVFYGMNSAIDYELRTQETTDKQHDDIRTTSGARNVRLDYLLNDKYFGKIDIDIAKKIIADHYDPYLKKDVMNGRSICRHMECDSNPVGKRYANSMFGCTDGKVVNSSMAKKLEFEGRFGSSCGREFVAKDHLDKYPKYKRYGEFLEDFSPEPWISITR
jgi:hypothetical protein